MPSRHARCSANHYSRREMPELDTRTGWRDRLRRWAGLLSVRAKGVKKSSPHITRPGSAKKRARS